MISINRDRNLRICRKNVDFFSNNYINSAKQKLNMENEKKFSDTIFNIATFIATIIPIYFIIRSTPSEINSQALITFGVIIAVAIIAIIYSYLYNVYKNIVTDIKNNKEDVTQIKKDLNFKEIIHLMDTRIAVVENLAKQITGNTKKGQIDPRIAIILILLILLYLFFKFK